jgi:hypothetical protein
MCPLLCPPGRDYPPRASTRQYKDKRNPSETQRISEGISLAPRTTNPKVGGSIPSGRTKSFKTLRTAHRRRFSALSENCPRVLEGRAAHKRKPSGACVRIAPEGPRRS